MTDPRMQEGGGKARRAVRALTDGQLVDAMRAGVPESWLEFDARYQPLLALFARRIGMSPDDADECITETLDDAKLRFTAHGERPPASIGGYLVRALRFKFMRRARAARRRTRHYAAAAESGAAREAEGPPVIRGVISEDALRAARGPLLVAEGDAATEGALAKFARLLTANLSEDERLMLGWTADLTPRRDIAGWLGIGYEATRKRIQRLGRALRASAPALLARLTADERREVERFLIRAGALRPSERPRRDEP